MRKVEIETTETIDRHGGDSNFSTELTLSQWKQLGEKLFGNDPMDWQFVCPSCNTVISVRDYKTVGAPESAVGYACIGRYLPNKRDAFGGESKNKNAERSPCNYTGAGLININPVCVIPDDPAPAEADRKQLPQKRSPQKRWVFQFAGVTNSMKPTR